MSQKNVNKFLAGAVTATMVATAVVTPAMAASFTDTGKLPEKIKGEVERAVELGYFQDSEKFNPAASITRGQVALVIARQVSGVAANDIAGLKAYVAKHGLEEKVTPFADVKKGETELYYASLIVKNAGAFTQDSLNPASNITRSQMAKVVVTAFDLKMNEDNKKEMTDISKVSNKEYIEILASNGVTEPQNGKFNPGNNVTRSQMASFLVRAHDGVEDANVNIVSAKAINAKTIEVKFNKAVDTDKAKVELLRGTFKQNVTLKWADDKKSVELIGATDYQAADYTVKVTGIAEKALTSDLKIEEVKIASIEILDDVAVVNKPLLNGVFQDGTTATVGYMVKDQYGTDITKKTTLTTNDNEGIKLKEGVITIQSSLIKGKKVNDLVPVVLIDTKTGLSTTKTIKLSAESTVSEIAVSGVYNAKGEVVEMNDKSKASEAFIVLDLKDQYGKEITQADKATGLVITNTNPTNLELAKNIESVKIGNSNKLVIKIADIKKAGDTDIILISTTNGKSAKYTVKVAETETTDGIAVGQPEVAVAKEETLIPLTVTDKTGNVITDINLLSNQTKGIKLSGKPVSSKELVVKNNQVYYKTTFDSAGIQALVFQTSTYKVATVTVEVKEEKVATVVRGLQNPLVIKKDEEKEITSLEHLVIEDQHGRVIEKSDAPIKVSLVDGKDVVAVDANNKVKGLKNGTATLKIELAEENKVSSAVEVKVQVTDGKEYKSYEVKKLGLLNANEANKVTVSGILANGGKVELSATDYKASTNVTGVQVEDGKLVVDKNKLDDIFKVDGKKVAEREVKVTYIINNDGSTVEQTYTISAAESKVQNFFFTSSEVLDGAKEITELKLEGDTFTVADVNLVTTNQYGKKAIVTSVSELKGLQSVTIMPSDASKVTIWDNGTAEAKVTALADTTVTVKVKVDGVTKDLKVTLTKAN